MRSLVSRSVLVSVVVVCSAVVLTACSNAPMGWNDGPGWRLTGSPTPIPPEKVYGSVAAVAPPPAARPVARPIAAAPAVTAQPAPVAPATPGDPRVVVVGPDDTLTGISSRYRTSISAIMAANNLASPRIVPGQRLVIPSRR